jgi:hypothetical protein
MTREEIDNLIIENIYTNDAGLITGIILQEVLLSMVEYNAESAHTHVNKSILDQLTQANLDVLSRLSIIDNKLRVNSDMYSTGEISAYGVGIDPGGGAGASALSELNDVALTVPNVGDLLLYNGTHWENKPQSAITPDLSAYAQKTYVDTAIANLVSSAPSTLDTLNELAAALGNDPNFATTVTNMIAGKENAIVAGNASQYFRGDKTWQTLNTSVVPESGNLYFTNARVKAYADTLYLPINGNAVSATKLQTARSFSITGAATASAVNFDGTSNVALNVTSLSAGNLTGTMPSSVLGNSTLYVGTTAIPLNRTSAWQALTGITSLQIGSASASAKLMYDAAKNAVYVVGSDGTTAVNFYATGEVSAYGAGTGGGSVSYNRLDAWSDYTSDKAGWVLSALLGNDLNTRLSLLEAGGSGSYQPLDADLTSIAGLTGTSGFLKKTGVNSWELDTNSYALASHTHTFASLTSKPTTLSGYGITDAANINHNHNGVYEPVFSKNTAFNKNFGTTAGTVSEGNHTHTFASLTNKPNTIAGYGITDGITGTGNANYLPKFTGASSIGNSVIYESDGKIGIGTTTPENSEKWEQVLDVRGTAHAKSIVTTTNVHTGVWSHNSGFYGAPAGGIIGTKSNHPLSLITNGAFKVIISNIGNVGIGTTTPSQKLHVIGNAIVSGTVTAPTFIGALSGNASSATKLQTARTIAGVSFDGTANIAIPFANLSSKPTTLAGYGISASDSLLTSNFQAKDADLTAIAALTGTGFLKRTGADTWSLDSSTYRPVGGSWPGVSVPGIREFGFVSNNGQGEVAFKYDSSSGGVLNMIIDGEIYCTDNSYKVWHSGNFNPSNYLPLSGGTLTGALNFANGTWNVVGDDTALGDCNIGGMIGIKGLNREYAGIAFFTPSNTPIGQLKVESNVLKFNDNVIYHSGNFTNLNQLTTRNFSDLQNKPTTLSGYGISVSDVLTQLKTVDGAGSGLDADLLDGVHNGDITAVAVRNKGGISNDVLPDSFSQGLSVNSVYNSGFPYNYGNTLTINNLGSSQLFITWNAAQTSDNPNVSQDIYVRSRRDAAGNNWSVWTRLLTNNNIGSFNAGSATKLQIPRTIWGQSFDGTANVDGLFTLNYQNIWTNSKIQLGRYDTTCYSDRAVVGVTNGNLHIDSYVGYGLYLNFYQDNNPSKAVIINPNGNVGIGTASTSYKLDVSGTGRFTGSLTAQSLSLSGALTGVTTIAASTSITTPKHDLGNGWALVASGSEVQMQYNGAAKMRFLSDGSFVAVGEVTAYS